MKYQLSLIIIIGLCLSFCNYVNGQAKPGSLSNGFIPEVVPPSPTAASLGKFGEWPVSYYTGVPDISIPIYEVKSRKLSLPISLSYHASGVKIEEVSGWTSNNWTLNAGGVITRTIVGLADNSPTGFYTRLREGKTFNPSYTLTDHNAYLFFRGVSDGEIDTEPDIYYFNFNGRSGKFFFDEGGNFHSIPENALKLTRNPLVSINEPNIWEIVDENGVTYTFGSNDGVSGGVEQSEVINKDMPQHNFQDNAWYLTRIVSNDKSDTISLQYTDKSEHYIVKSTQSLRELLHQMLNQPPSNTSWASMLYLSQVCYNGTPNGDPLNTQSSTVGKSALSLIKWAQGEVRFFSNTARQDVQMGKMLDSVQVFAKATGALIKNLSLHYSYKGGRYYLDSLSDYNNNHTDKLVHSFYYFPGLPSRFSNSQDHWGYYNAAANNNLLPTSSLFQTPLSANREPNESAAKCGTLRRIKYPTGGYSDFEYELHRYAAGSIPNAPETEIGAGSLLVATYNRKRPMVHDSITLFDVPFAQNGSTISISYENYYKPNDKREGWLPYVRLERLNGDGSYVLVQEWNAFDQFPGGNISPNTDGSFNFTVPAITVPISAGSYRLSANNSCSGFRCPDEDTSKAAIYATMSYQRYVQVPGTQQPPPVAGGLRIKSIASYDNLSSKPVEIKRYEYEPGYILNYPRYVHYYAEDRAPSSPEFGNCMTDFAKYREITSTSQAILGFTQSSSTGYTSVKEYKIDGEGKDNGYTHYKYLYSPDSTNSFYWDHTYWSEINIETANRFLPVNSYDYKRGLLSEKNVYANAINGYKLVSSTREQYNFNDGDTSNLYRRLKGLRVKKMRTVKYPCYKDLNGVLIPDGHFEYDFGYGFYNLITSWVQKVSTEEKTYSTQGDSAIATFSRYYYDNNKHLGISRTIMTDSEGDTLTTYNKYPHEMISTGITTPYSEMVSRNMIGNVVEQRVVKNGSTELNKTRINYASFSSNLIAPSTLETAVMGNVSEINATLQKYDATGNVAQYKERNGITQSIIYGYGSSLAIAKATNAELNNIAYTGFEETDKGSWQFSGNYKQTTALTGKSCYELASGSITKTGFNTSLQYIVSYWSNGGSALVNGQTGASGKTTGSWTYYQHLVPSGQSTVTVSGSVLIDELRFYPKTAQMTAYVYEPLVGLTAQCDANNNISFYEYDDFNRLSTIRDYTKKILKRYEYSYVKPITEVSGNAFFNAEKTQSFTRQTCSGGTPSTVVYTVPAEKYVSYTSQSDADNKAMEDIALNGQNNANNYGYCLYGNNTVSGTFTRNNCPDGGVPSSITYTVEAGKYLSANSQAEADAWAQTDIDQHGQSYANTNGICTYSNDAMRSDFTTVCTNGARGSVISYNVPAGKHTSTISKADANAKAQQDINTNGQTYANTNGTCLFYNVAMSQTFTKSNCNWGYTGAAIVYSVPADRYSSATSQAAANTLAQNDINANGQNYANTNGACVDDNSANVFISERPNAGVNAFTVTISLPNGTVLFQQTFKELGAPSLPFKVSVTNGSYTVKLEGMQQFKATVNGTEQTVTGSRTWTVSSRVIIEVYK